MMRRARQPKKDSFVALLTGLPLFGLGCYLAFTQWAAARADGFSAESTSAHFILSTPFLALAGYGANLSLRYLAPAWIARFNQQLWWLRGAAALGVGGPIVLRALVDWVRQGEIRDVVGPLIFASVAIGGAYDLWSQLELRRAQARRGPPAARKSQR